MKVKIFDAVNAKMLEEHINKFLTENLNISVKDIKYQYFETYDHTRLEESLLTYTAMIIYS